jgi:hypothetical protein
MLGMEIVLSFPRPIFRGLNSMVTNKNKDILEQIIDQCMWYDYKTTSYNGGTWTWGSTYAGGWFWADNSKPCVHVVSKRGVERTETEFDSRGAVTNFTLVDGTTMTINRQVWLDLSEDGSPKLVREETYAESENP